MPLRSHSAIELRSHSPLVLRPHGPSRKIDFSSSICYNVTTVKQGQRETRSRKISEKGKVSLMKTKTKRKISMLLAALMCVTTLAFGSGTALAAGSPFTDVSSSDWFYPAVNAMAEGGLVAGVGNNRFAPNQNMSIAAFSTIMCRATGLDTSSSNSLNCSLACSFFFCHSAPSSIR